MSMQEQKAAARAAADKKGFNALDVLLVALLLMIVFAMAMQAFAGIKDPSDRIVTILIDESDAEQLSLAGIGAEQDAKVYDADSGELLGRLTASYDAANMRLTVLIDEETRMKKIFVCGQTLSVRVGQLICRRAVISDIREV